MVQALQELPIRNNKFRCSSPVERPRIHIQICKNIFYARPTNKESVPMVLTNIFYSLFRSYNSILVLY
jgi:hypothetical protein